MTNRGWSPCSRVGAARAPLLRRRSEVRRHLGALRRSAALAARGASADAPRRGSDVELGDRRGPRLDRRSCFLLQEKKSWKTWATKT